MTYLLEVSTSLDIVLTNWKVVWEFIFCKCQ